MKNILYQVLTYGLSSSIIEVTFKRWRLLVDPANYCFDFKNQHKLVFKGNGDIVTHSIDFDVPFYQEKLFFPEVCHLKGIFSS